MILETMREAGFDEAARKREPGIFSEYPGKRN